MGFPTVFSNYHFANEFHNLYFTFVFLYYALRTTIGIDLYKYQLLEMIIKCSTVGILWYVVDDRVKQLKKESQPYITLKTFRTGVVFSSSLISSVIFARLIKFFSKDSKQPIVGDAILVWDTLHISVFIGGLVSFLISHVLYVSTFGFKPVKLQIAAPVFACALITLLVGAYYERQLENRIDDQLFILIVLACGFYSLVLYAGVWRSIVLLTMAVDDYDYKKAKLALAGYSSYLFSDSLLAFSKFVLRDWECAWYVFMFAYFAAQFLLVEANLVDFQKLKKTEINKKET